MKTRPFDAAKYSTLRDVPRYLLWAAFSLARGRVRFAGRLAKLAGRVTLLSIGLLTLSGCAHTVIAPCISREQLSELERQSPPRVKDRLTGKADEDIRIIAGSNLRLRAWSDNLLQVVRVCAK